jgi:CBS domain-containing protein
MTNVWLPPMTAGDIMTKDVLFLRPDLPTRTVAKLLLGKGISAAPVVGPGGDVVGMVSEADLLGRQIEGRASNRMWWLEMLAEGEDLATEFLDYLKSSDPVARDVMRTPVVTVSESTRIEEIAEILQRNHIKRVPVLRDGRLVGIVARADLIRALSEISARPR